MKPIKSIAELASAQTRTSALPLEELLYRASALDLALEQGKIKSIRLITQPIEFSEEPTFLVTSEAELVFTGVYQVEQDEVSIAMELHPGQMGGFDVKLTMVMLRFRSFLSSKIGIQNALPSSEYSSIDFAPSVNEPLPAVPSQISCRQQT